MYSFQNRGTLWTTPLNQREVIAFVLGDREGAKFHLNQALVIWLAGLLSFIPCIGWLWGIFCFICAVMGFISAVNGEEKAVPLLGQIRLLK